MSLTKITPQARTQMKTQIINIAVRPLRGGRPPLAPRAGQGKEDPSTSIKNITSTRRSFCLSILTPDEENPFSLGDAQWTYRWHNDPAWDSPEYHKISQLQKMLHQEPSQEERSSARGETPACAPSGAEPDQQTHYK